MAGSDGNGNGNGAHPPEGPDPAPVLPGWVPGPGFQRRPQPRPRRDQRRRRLRRRLFVAAGACVAVAFVVAFTSSVPTVAPSIDDDGYVAAADAVCEPVQRQLQAAGEPEEEPTDEERADAIEGRVDAFAAMVEQLAALDATAAASSEVAAWLEDWRDVLASGRATAAARRVGDGDEAAAASASGIGPTARVNRFAVANGMRACTVRF